MTVLAIDIGNTNITIGVFDNQNLTAHWRLATDHERMPDEYGIQILGLLTNIGLSKSGLEGICLASVAPPVTGRVIQACQEYCSINPLVINHRLKTGISILYDNPDAVGADRIADAVAVKHLHGAPACVIDFGTATTFNAINRNNEYLGGAIAPGIGIALDALFTRTAKLPRIELETPPSVIGTNTVHAIQAGMIFGYVSLVEGMVSRFKILLGADTKIIATGGLATIISSETEVIDIVSPWLTLEGIKIIWDLNKPS